MNEKKFVDEKLIEELSTKDIQSENDEQKINKKLLVGKILSENVEQKVNKKLFVDKFDVQSKIIKLIREAYSENVILQRLIKIKKLERRRVLIDITKAKIKLKLKRCKIRDDLF